MNSSPPKTLMSNLPKIIVIGGGTGTYTVLIGLKKYPLDLTAIVSMADSGGSAKKERDEFGLLPVSDVRKALLAMTDDKHENILRDLFNFRFANGIGISGTSFGNFFLIALSRILGSQKEAIKKAGEILRIKGEVLPVSFDQTNLVMEYEDGKVILGEHFLDEFPGDGTKRITNFYLLPPAYVNSEAIGKITKADLIILAPGDLYGSLIANFLVDGVAEAITKSPARKVYVVNLMTKYGQTYDFSAADHLTEIEKYLGQKCIDKIIMNTGPLPKKILVPYARECDFPVYDDLSNDPRVIRGDFLAETLVEKEKDDSIKRSLVRHDPNKLAKTILSLVNAK